MEFVIFYIIASSVIAFASFAWYKAGYEAGREDEANERDIGP